MLSYWIIGIIPEKNNFGLQIEYKEQLRPSGLPQAFTIGEKFIGKDNVSLILGDNFFYGQNLTSILKKNSNFKVGAKIFLHPVKNPQNYGVATLSNKKKVLKLVEKPKKTKSNLAVTGLYFFDNNVVEFTKKLKPSKRGELEIVDLLNIYRRNKKLNADFIGRGGASCEGGAF